MSLFRIWLVVWLLELKVCKIGILYMFFCITTFKEHIFGEWIVSQFLIYSVVDVYQIVEDPKAYFRQDFAKAKKSFEYRSFFCKKSKLIFWVFDRHNECFSYLFKVISRAHKVNVEMGLTLKATLGLYHSTSGLIGF